jgi:hypothetical protein
MHDIRITTASTCYSTATIATVNTNTTSIDTAIPITIYKTTRNITVAVVNE